LLINNNRAKINNDYKYYGGIMNIKKQIIMLFTLSLCLIGINSFAVGDPLKDIRLKLIDVKSKLAVWDGSNEDIKQKMFDTLREIENSAHVNTSQKTRLKESVHR
jgi:hypothetical protein